jgi:hypothetical protein
MKAGSSNDIEKEADKLMKKAQKEISPSLLDFRLKPDWEQAAPNLKQAAKLYTVGYGIIFASSAECIWPMMACLYTHDCSNVRPMIKP